MSPDMKSISIARMVILPAIANGKMILELEGLYTTQKFNFNYLVREDPKSCAIHDRCMPPLPLPLPLYSI
jgi:hypothetical protein